MMKALILVVMTVCFFQKTAAQNANRNYINYKNENNIVTINVSDGQYIIKYYTDKIIENTFVPTGERVNLRSQVLVLKPKNVVYKINESINILSINSKGISVIIQKSPFQISYFNQNKPLISEKNGYIKKDTTAVLDFNLEATEVLYGGGARALGMNRRGNKLRLYNQSAVGYERAALMGFCMPVMLSSKIYAIRFDNAATGFLDLDANKDNSIQYETISGRKTYQIIAANTWPELIENFTNLTGKQPLPALWTMGNLASRTSYKSQSEVMQTVEKFSKQNIPLDAVVLDSYWFGKNSKTSTGNLAWDKDNFPNAAKMLTDLNKKGIKTVLTTQPFILSTAAKWQDAVDKKILATHAKGATTGVNFYAGTTGGVIDIFKIESKTWFWNIYKDLITQGVGGICGTLADAQFFVESLNTSAGKADEVRNVYGNAWAKMIQDGYRRDFPSVRPFILMDAGTTGAQQFGLIPWSGDASSSWGGLQAQPEIALQMGMQGMGYMHSNLGGYSGQNIDDELFLRWIQYGVFNPVFRLNGQNDLATELVNRNEKTIQLAKKAIELRYQLLPYNYNLALENSQKGLPLMRPLLFEEPQNIEVQSQSDEFLWGNDILVAPVLSPGQKEKTVYFPKTNNWYDFYSNTKYTAGSNATIKLTEDRIPTFVRAGAFIPMIQTIQNTKDYSLANFDLHYYFEEAIATSDGQLFNDDGKTNNSIKDEKYELLTFNGKFADKILTIQLRCESFFFNIKTEKNVNLILHNCPAIKARIGNKSFKLKSENGLIQIPIKWKIGTDVEILIQM